MTQVTVCPYQTSVFINNLRVLPSNYPGMYQDIIRSDDVPLVAIFPDEETNMNLGDTSMLQGRGARGNAGHDLFVSIARIMILLLYVNEDQFGIDVAPKHDGHK